MLARALRARHIALQCRQRYPDLHTPSLCRAIPELKRNTGYLFAQYSQDSGPSKSDSERRDTALPQKSRGKQKRGTGKSKPLVRRYSPGSKEKSQSDDVQKGPQSPFNEELNLALQNLDINAVIRIYETHGLQTLRSRQATKLGQLLTKAGRIAMTWIPYNHSAAGKLPKLLQLARNIVVDIQKGNVPDCSAAILVPRLLMFYRDTKEQKDGTAFWGWLRHSLDAEGEGDSAQQMRSREILHPGTYGTAIAMLASFGSPLSELNALYSEALTRFPGSFQEYALSANAIIADRTAKPATDARYLRLLHGYMYAHCVHGHVREAYLALDSALRIQPTQAEHDLFLDLFANRPVAESFVVFALACRSQRSFRIESVNARIRYTATSGPLGDSTPHRAVALRQILTATCLHLVSGGPFPQNLLNGLIVSITRLAHTQCVSEATVEQRGHIVALLLSLVRRVLAVARANGASPGAPAFNAIIGSIGGPGKFEDAIDTALNDMQTLGLKPTRATYRAILAAAGAMGNKALVQESWDFLKRLADADGDAPSEDEINLVLRSALNSDDEDLAQVVLGELGYLLPAALRTIEAQRPLAKTHFISAATKGETLEELEHTINKIKADVDAFEEKITAAPEAISLNGVSLPMTLNLPHSRLSLNDVHLRKIYDEMTTDPTQREQIAANDAAATTSQGPNYADLRYENWKTVNYLLELSERTEAEFKDLADQAAADGTNPPSRPDDSRVSSCAVDVSSGYGLGDLPLPQPDETPSEERVQEVRAEIYRLRGMNVPV